MDAQKLIYDIRERVGAISDDRRIDDRYIKYQILNARNALIRKLMSRNINFNPYGLTQDHHIKLAPASRSLSSGIIMDCQILRSIDKIPELVYASTYGNWMKVRTIDVLKNTIEVIETARAPWVTFEFPVVYAFLDNGYLYFAAPDGDTSLKNAVLSGVFKDPDAIDKNGDGNPDKDGDIPITDDILGPVMNMAVDIILRRVKEDPLNNSEPDYDRQPNPRREEEAR